MIKATFYLKLQFTAIHKFLWFIDIPFCGKIMLLNQYLTKCFAIVIFLRKFHVPILFAVVSNITFFLLIQIPESLRFALEFGKNHIGIFFFAT